MNHWRAQVKPAYDILDRYGILHNALHNALLRNGFHYVRTQQGQYLIQHPSQYGLMMLRFREPAVFEQISFEEN